MRIKTVCPIYQGDILPTPLYFTSLEILFLFFLILTIRKIDRWEREHRLNAAPHSL